MARAQRRDCPQVVLQRPARRRIHPLGCLDRAAFLVDQLGHGHLLFVSVHGRRPAQAVGRIRAPALRPDGVAPTTHRPAARLELARFCAPKGVLVRLCPALLHGYVERGHLLYPGLSAHPSRPVRPHPHWPRISRHSHQRQLGHRRLCVLRQPRRVVQLMVLHRAHHAATGAVQSLRLHPSRPRRVHPRASRHRLAVFRRPNRPRRRHAVDGAWAPRRDLAQSSVQRCGH